MRECSKIDQNPTRGRSFGSLDFDRGSNIFSGNPSPQRGYGTGDPGAIPHSGDSAGVRVRRPTLLAMSLRATAQRGGPTSRLLVARLLAY
jgi:hypothetical protein